MMSAFTLAASRARAAVLAAALIAPVLTVPGSLLATLSPEGAPSGLEAVEQERDRLADVRERVVRRVALRRTLEEQISELGQVVETLRAQREASEKALGQARDDALALERRLDRLVPRLAARADTVEARREQAAHALADLVGISRQVELDPAIRARLLAVSPVMLERLRSADASLAGLREERERMIAAYQTVREREPALLAERQQLERQRSLAQRRRDARIEQLEHTELELAALQREEQALAKRVIAAEAAQAMRAEPQPDQPALRPDLALAGAADQLYGKAAVKGSAMRLTALAEVMDALGPSSSQVAVAALRERIEPAAGLEGQPPYGVPPPPPAKPIGAVPKADANAGTFGRDRTSLGRNATVDVALLEPDVGGSQLLTLAPARIARPDTPIMPIPGQVVTGFGDGAGGREKAAITIAAAPGQAVAAPADGRVVFARPFRSYGLLLIIEHDLGYHTLLWGFSRLDVAPEDDVRIGQVVGVMGVDAGEGPELHVELRQHGRPVNPLPWLAASSSKVRG